MLVTTELESYESFTKREIEGVTAAQKIQEMVGNPSKCDYE